MRARKFPEGKLEVTIGLWLFNPARNHDKLVTLLVERSRRRGRSLLPTTLGLMEVEDKGHAQARSFPIRDSDRDDQERRDEDEADHDHQGRLEYRPRGGHEASST